MATQRNWNPQIGPGVAHVTDTSLHVNLPMGEAQLPTGPQALMRRVRNNIGVVAPRGYEGNLPTPGLLQAPSRRPLPFGPRKPGSPTEEDNGDPNAPTERSRDLGPLQLGRRRSLALGGNEPVPATSTPIDPTGPLPFATPDYKPLTAAERLASADPLASGISPLTPRRARGVARNIPGQGVLF